MNELGVSIFNNEVKVGDELSISITRFDERMSYRGIVTKITERSVWVRNNQELDFFEALVTPALEEFSFSEIYAYFVA